MLAVVAAAVVLLVVAPTAYVIGRRLGDSGHPTAATPPSGSPSTTHRATSSSSSSASASSTAGTTPDIYACPTDADAAKWGCLKSARSGDGKLYLTYTSNFALSSIQDAAHYHFHLYLANPGPGGTTQPPDSVMQQVPNAGSWFIIYDGNITTIDNTTIRGGKELPLDVSPYSLFCVRVATGLHGLALDKKGGYHTGNCVKITS